ncbi:MAG: sulfite exporter TauE/SafE family protein [Candidatus Krumholzibacteria bacterium]|nr:sulfite exporter TauE/SafE family protein [Candidatus Krumholzibacteria bacterium]
MLGDALAYHPFAAIAALFVAGVLTSLTPCVYPMVPITVGLLSGTAGGPHSRRRVVGLTLAYVVGLASLYAVLGLLAGLTGSLFGTVGSSWWARLTIAGLLAAFGLAMLDVLPVPVPARLTTWSGGLRGGSIPAALLLGATSGIVAAPCGAPAFATVLTWVATTRSAAWGFVYLFAFSLGMTALLVAVGVSSGIVARLPRAGAWMVRVKRGGGVLLLAMAAYYAWEAWTVR